jgi:glycerophosphoryl diester phosphodiesterase
MSIPLVIAHRGAHSRALENSLEAVRNALELPVDMIELDIRRSRDGELYVMHDALTGRTSETNVELEFHTSKELAGIRLRNGEPIPTLENVLALVAGACGLNLEIKSHDAGELTARRLLSAGYRGPVLVSSFKEREIDAARLVMPSLTTGLIFDVFAVRNISSYRERGYSLVSLRRKTVSEKLVAACHEQGIKVYVWTVNEEDEMRKLMSWEVDGIYSDRPELLKDVIAGRG